MRALLLACAVLGLSAAFASETVHEISAPLSHADGDFEPHAAGVVGLRSGSDFERFSVVVEGVSEAATLVVQLGDGHDALAEVGTMPAGSSRREFVRTTLEGGHLPLDVARAGELSGRAIRIANAEGHAILVGRVPAFDAPPDGPGEEPHPAEPLVARADFVRPENSPYDDSRGSIVVIQRDGSAAVRFEVNHLAPLTSYTIWLGTHEEASLVDDFTANGEGGALVVRDTANGAELPGGVDGLAALAGVHVEVRHGSDVVLLGAIPHLGDAHDMEDVHESGDFHDEHWGADVHVEVHIHPGNGHEHMDVVMHDLPTAHETGDTLRAARLRRSATLYVEDANGSLVAVDSARIRRRGRARLRYDTRRGGSLPLDVATLRELSGRAFEVRVEGTSVVGGIIPTF